MSEQLTTSQIADEMYELVKEYAGKKRFKSSDLTKEVIAKHGDVVNKKDCKAAIRELMDSGRCVYGYAGGSFIALPGEEGAAKG